MNRIWLRLLLALSPFAASPGGMANAQQIAQREVALTIAHSEEISLSDQQVDQILAAASAVLLAQDSNADVSCPLNMKRSATLIPLKASQLPAKLQSYEDMVRLQDLPGDVKVVREIEWCGGFGFYLGCASSDQGVMAVVPLEDGNDGILWAHEYGHTRGLMHRHGQPKQVMDPVVAADHREVNSDECAKFTAPPPQFHGARPRLNRKILVQPAAPQAKPAAAAIPIREFVRRHWVHGLPYDEALRYGSDAVPELLAVLADEKERPYWANAVLMIGLTGSAEQVPGLIAFFRRGPEQISASEARAKSAVLIALGFLQNRAPSPAAAEFLVANSNPNRVERMPWMPASAGAFQVRAREIARSAALGLAYSGRPFAGQLLADIQNSIQRGAYTLNTAVGEPHEALAELRRIHETVSRRGLRFQLRGGE